MESVINNYISHELVSNPGVLPLQHDSSLLASGILDSLAVLKLVLFLEEEYGIVMDAEDVLPENFETIDAICARLRSRLQGQEVQK